MLVIAKAYEGEPLCRVLTGYANGLAYVLNPSVVDNGDIDEFSGVGFPPDSVFQHNSELLSQLEAAWESRDSASLANLWLMAEPLMADA